MQVRYEEVTNVERLHDAHNAKYGILDTTNQYDTNDKLEQPIVPQSFEVSMIAGAPAAVDGLNVAEAISFGDHGGGTLFTADNPWTSVGISGGKPGDAREKNLKAVMKARHEASKNWGRIRNEVFTPQLEI
jgi:hypothetical protein